MAMLRFFAWIGGVSVLPAILSDTRSGMKDNISKDITDWWHFPLIALAVLAGVWILGNLFPLIAQAFAVGYGIGAVIAVFYSLWIPENTALYFLSSLFVLPIAWFTAVGQGHRINMSGI